MNSDIVTRPARKADATDIALLVNIAAHGLPARRWAEAPEAEGTYEALEVGRADVLKDDGDFPWRQATMAEADGETIGMLHGDREPEEPSAELSELPAFLVPIMQLAAEVPGYWYISMLGVYREWRGRGVGSVLLDVAEQKRVQTGSRGLALIVEDVNAGARRLYQRRGFSVRASRPMVRLPSGGPEGQDWLLMAKD